MSLQGWGRGAVAKPSPHLWEPANSRREMSYMARPGMRRMARPRSTGPDRRALVVPREDWSLGRFTKKPGRLAAARRWGRESVPDRWKGRIPGEEVQTPAASESLPQYHRDNGLPVALWDVADT